MKTKTIFGSVLISCILFMKPAFAGIHEYGLLGDSGIDNTDTRETRTSMLRKNITQLIMPGDNLYELSEGYAKVWNPWKDAGFTFDLVALGNHTLGYKEEMQYFGMPGEYYTKVIDGVRFIVLNSDNIWSAAKQAEWVEQVLKNSSEKMNFLVYHHPTYTVSQSHFWWEKLDFQGRMRTILARYKDKITALLLGHDHIASVINFGGIPAIVAGGASQQRNEMPVAYVAWDNVWVETQWLYTEKAAWGKLAIDTESGTAKVSFIRSSDDEDLCQVTIAPGTVEYSENCSQKSSKSGVSKQE